MDTAVIVLCCPHCGHKTEKLERARKQFCFRCELWIEAVPAEQAPRQRWRDKPAPVWWKLLAGAVVGTIVGLAVYLIVAAITAALWTSETTWAPTTEQINNHQVHAPVWHWPPLAAIFVPVAIVVAVVVALKIDD